MEFLENLMEIEKNLMEIWTEVGALKMNVDEGPKGKQKVGRAESGHEAFLTAEE